MREIQRQTSTFAYRLAMADTSAWHNLIEHDPGRMFGSYFIKSYNGNKIAELQYFRDKLTKEIEISSLFVHPKHQHKGIGQALIERIARDNPDFSIDPGMTTPSGNDFTEHLRQIIPDAQDRIYKYYEPKILDEEDTKYYNEDNLQHIHAAIRLAENAIQDTQKLYRILDLSFPDHPSAGYFGNSHKGFARIPDLMHHDPGNELPDVILDGIRQHVGPHWTKSKMWARDNPWHHPPGDKEFQVILGLDHPNGLGRKMNSDIRDMQERYEEEREETLKRGTPVDVNSMWFRGPGQQQWKKLRPNPRTMMAGADDTVTLYHWTTPEIAKSIIGQGFRASDHPHYPGTKKPVWFSEYPDDEAARENVTGTTGGDLVQVAVQVPRHAVENDYFADDVADVADSSGWRVVGLDNLAGLPVRLAANQIPTMGIGINDKYQDFTGQILRGEKTIETRDTHSLKPYVGKRIGIVRTGVGPATLVGYANVGEPVFYGTPEEFDADYERHRVGKDSHHYIKPQGKFGYPLTEVEAEPNPRVLTTRGNKARSLL